MPRKPRFLGQFYAATEMELEKQITDCFNDKNGPGDLPLNKRFKKVQGIIAPHAGYQFSGPCAAWAYKEIAEAEFPNIFIIIGPNHNSTVNALSIEGYETPFGLARVDQEFARALLEKNTDIVLDEAAHAEEHSIEVQIPFLQFATKDKMHELKIVPIILGPNVDYGKLALDIKETLMDTNKTAIIIASSDFTHYGHQYHHIPFSTDVKKTIYAQDRAAIEFIEHLNPEGLLQYTEDNHMNICGEYPIATLLKTLKASKVNLEHYYTSADLEEVETYKNAVSYAAIIFNDPKSEE